MTPLSQGLIDIAKLVFQFARVNRVTLHDDGVTSESDTDHTVMLSVCACALGEALYKDTLDIGKVAQFAIIHDLVEAYAGDTNTFNISDKDREEKEKREQSAYEKISLQFKDVYPWIATTIGEYESQSSLEARFVKTVDKLMTKLTHLTNDGAYLKIEGLTEEETTRHYQDQVAALEEKAGKDFPEVIEIQKYFTSQILKRTYH